MDDDRLKKEQVIKLLEEVLFTKKAKRGRNYSQKQWAAEMGFPGDTPLSEYMTGVNLPKGKGLQRLASDPDIGYRIYDALGLPRPMPDNPVVKEIVDIAFSSPEAADELLIYARKIKAARRGQNKSTMRIACSRVGESITAPPHSHLTAA